MENPLDELDRIQSEMDSPTPPFDLTVPPSSSSHPPLPPIPQPTLKSSEEVRCRICKMTLKNEQDILVNHARMYHSAISPPPGPPPSWPARDLLSPSSRRGRGPRQGQGQMGGGGFKGLQV